MNTNTINCDQTWTGTSRGASAALAYRPALDHRQGRSHSGAVGFFMRSPFFVTASQITGRALSRPAFFPHSIRSGALPPPCGCRLIDNPRVTRHWRKRLRGSFRLFHLKPSNHADRQITDCSEYHHLSPSEVRGVYARTRRTIGAQNLGNPNQTNE